MSKIARNKQKIPQKDSKVLFFGRANCEASIEALNHLVRLGFKVTSIFSKGDDGNLPLNIEAWRGDYIFCFRSKFILPKTLIEKAMVAAINFHPGSPEYPGSGCINYALFENSETYGVTCHLMTEKIDDGRIIECRRFMIKDTDTVNSLLKKTHRKLFELFLDVTSGISSGGKVHLDGSLRSSNTEKWSGLKRKIVDLDRLSIVDKNISKKELIRLIRATYTKNFPPKVVLHGYNFYLKFDKDI